MQTVVQCKQCGKSFSAGVVNRDFEGVCPSCVAAFALFDDVSRSPLETVKSPPARPDHDVTTLFLTPGTVIQGVEILEVLGQGGMGVVYKGRQQGLDRLVALKVMSDRLAGDAEFVKRFEKEAKAMAALSHANIVGVFNFGIDAGRCFIVMEYVDGANLRQVLRERKLSPAEALKIVPQLCDALEYAHAEGVVHRDIKPENILVDRRGRVKITDFGLAKMAGPAAQGTMTGLVMGTPHYMAPEQVEAPKDVDHRADIYSMGVVLYELLTGELPIGRFQLPSQRGAVDARLDQVVLRALDKRRDARYQHAGQMRDEVSRVSEFIPVARFASTSRPPATAGVRLEARIAAPPPAPVPSQMSGWIGTGFGFSLAALVLGLVGLLVAALSGTGPHAAGILFGIAGSFGGVGFLCTGIGVFDLLFSGGRKHGLGLAVLSFAFEFAVLVLALIGWLAAKPSAVRPPPVSSSRLPAGFDPLMSSLESPQGWQRTSSDRATTRPQLLALWANLGAEGEPTGVARAHLVRYRGTTPGATASYVVLELTPGTDFREVQARLPAADEWIGEGRLVAALYSPRPLLKADIAGYQAVRTSLLESVGGPSKKAPAEALPAER